MPDDVDPEVDALFDLPVDGFVAARDALARARRAAGDREAATALKQLRRPTLSAWALNQVARRRSDDVRTLVEQGAALAEAQEQALVGAPVDLREAGRARTETLRRLTRAAEAVLGGKGSAAHRDEVVATLTAASSDPAAGTLLLEGRLSEPLEAPSGFGGPFALSTVPAGSPSAAAEQARASRSAEAGSDAEPAPSSGSAQPPPARRDLTDGGGDGREQEEPGRTRRARLAAGPDEGGASAAGSSRDGARMRPPKGRGARSTSAGGTRRGIPEPADSGAAPAAARDDLRRRGAGEVPAATDAAPERAPLRLMTDRDGRKARGAPAPKEREVSNAGEPDPEDAAPLDGPVDRPAEEVAGAATHGSAGSPPGVAEAAEAAAAEAQAEAARAAAAADGVAERVAALEEELVEARAALVEAEQEAVRRRRAAAAAAEAARAAVQEVVAAGRRDLLEGPHPADDLVRRARG